MQSNCALFVLMSALGGGGVGKSGTVLLTTFFLNNEAPLYASQFDAKFSILSMYEFIYVFN